MRSIVAPGFAIEGTGLSRDCGVGRFRARPSRTVSRGMSTYRPLYAADAGQGDLVIRRMECLVSVTDVRMHLLDGLKIAALAALPALHNERCQELSGSVSAAEVNKANILGFGADLAEDHPGYADPQYKARRAAITQLALQHHAGTPVPYLEYLPEERECWGTVLTELKRLYPTHACQEFNRNLELFEFREDTVPQLESVSQILRQMTGWQIQPVAGLLHPSDFLRGLASRVFHSTQYMRHHSQPMYTPEPDICHELLDLVQAIGTASLGADEKLIWHLTKVYWYTVEFGVVREDDQVKAFGAGLLSSYGEMRHMRSGQAKLWSFDPFGRQPKMSYKDGYQKGYFVLDSFRGGEQLLHKYCDTILQRSVR